MRLIPSTAITLAAICLFCACAAAQTPDERMRECRDPGYPDIQLVGVVTDAATGEPLDDAVITFGEYLAEYLAGFSDESGCYVAGMEAEHLRGRQRVTVQVHRYLAADTMLELSPERIDTVHFALRPTAPGCCRLQGEWSLRMALDPAARKQLDDEWTELEGTIVFSDRLPPIREDGGMDTPLLEDGRFHIERLAQDVEADDGTGDGSVAPADYRKQAAGEVFAGDSVVVGLVPLMTTGGITLVGRIRGDSIRGRWIQNDLFAQIEGSFVMHRVPASPLGDSLVAQGIRAAARAREEEAERRLRVGTVRLRVVDARTGRYARVDVWVQREGGGEDHEANILVRTPAEGDGWSDPAEIEPGRYELFILQYECGGRLHVTDAEVEANQRPWGKVAVLSRQPAEKELRVDLCAIQGHDFGTVPADADGADADDAAPAAPAKP
ncbi:MAG TPA: hypothetical protein VFR37_05895 [Longimicrobium sp.]|nr:hypothetical protein [Longimicrobium sp.]